MLAGAAGELVASPEWLLKMVVLSSVVVAPVESSGRSVVFYALASRQRRRVHLPRAGVREVADPAVEDPVGAAVFDRAGVVGRHEGWRCSGAEERRLPGRSEVPPSSSNKWRSGGRFQRRSAFSVTKTMPGLKRTCL